MAHSNPTSRQNPGARRYLEAVKVQARRSKDVYLSSGHHYDALARFLGNDGNEVQPYERSSFSHIVVKTITKDGIVPTTYDSHSDHSAFSLATTNDHRTAELVFLRGYMSPMWLNRVCEQTNVHPEYFRRHLRFMDKNEFFDLPSLPSGSKDILRLRITTICTRSVPWTFEEIEKTHKEEEEYILKHQRSLSTAGRVGDSIVRRFAVHNETCFSIGQDVSCIVKQTKNGWIGLVWNDVGRDLYEQSPGSWFSEDQQALSGHHTCLPVIQHPLRTENVSLPKDLDRNHSITGPNLGQSAALLPLQYGTSLDRSAMLADASYALSDVVAFAAASEKQFLNMISAQIERDLRLYLDFMEVSLTNIGRSKILLDEHLRSTRETLTSLRWRTGSRATPRAFDDDPDMQRKSWLVDESHSDMVADFESLVSETQALIRRCVEGSDLIINRALLDESRKAAEQNSRVRRLTTLAFLFVPASFVAAFFGMNFEEFGQGKLGVWVGVVVMVIFAFGSAAVCYYDYVRRSWKQTARLLLGKDVVHSGFE